MAQQQKLLENPAYQFLFISSEGVFRGFFGIWHLTGFTFLEHFAVAPAVRGEGIGRKALEAVVKATPLPFILEAEPPLTEVAKRRISFYERAGFWVNDFEYRQPPYGAEKPWVKLLLLSYPHVLGMPGLEEIKTQLYRQVYQQAV